MSTKTCTGNERRIQEVPNKCSKIKRYMVN